MSVPNPYRIVIADDHAPFRQGLKSLLSKKSEVQVVGEAGDGIELLTLLNRLAMNQLNPHLVITDIVMPNLPGIEAARRIKVAYPEMKVLILSMHREIEYVEHALSAGAHGYLTKADANDELFSAIETVKKGGIYMSPLLRQGGNL